MTPLEMRSRAQAGACQTANSLSFPAVSFAKWQLRAMGIFTASGTLFAGGVAVALLLSCRCASAETAAIPAAAVASMRDPFAGFMTEASSRFGVPVAWIRAIIQVESGGDINATSPAGAMGLMQIMSETWTDLSKRYGLGSNSYDPHDNIIAGAAYLRELHDLYGEPGFLAAYNAGPSRYEDYLARGRALPPDTQKYVAILAPIVAETRLDMHVLVAAAVRSWTEAPLFAAQASRNQTTPESSPKLHADKQSIDMQATDSPALAPQSSGLFVAVSRAGSR